MLTEENFINNGKQITIFFEDFFDSLLQKNLRVINILNDIKNDLSSYEKMTGNEYFNKKDIDLAINNIISVKENMYALFAYHCYVETLENTNEVEDKQ